MPVVRPKSPRVEGGRCYPKLTSWSNIARGTLLVDTPRGTSQPRVSRGEFLDGAVQPKATQRIRPGEASKGNLQKGIPRGILKGSMGHGTLTPNHQNNVDSHRKGASHQGAWWEGANYQQGIASADRDNAKYKGDVGTWWEVTRHQANAPTQYVGSNSHFLNKGRSNTHLGGNSHHLPPSTLPGASKSVHSRPSGKCQPSVIYHSGSDRNTQGFKQNVNSGSFGNCTSSNNGTISGSMRSRNTRLGTHTVPGAVSPGGCTNNTSVRVITHLGSCDKHSGPIHRSSVGTLKAENSRAHGIPFHDNLSGHVWSNSLNDEPRLESYHCCYSDWSGSGFRSATSLTSNNTAFSSVNPSPSHCLPFSSSSSTASSSSSSPSSPVSCIPRLKIECAKGISFVPQPEKNHGASKKHHIENYKHTPLKAPQAIGVMSNLSPGQKVSENPMSTKNQYGDTLQQSVVPSKCTSPPNSAALNSISLQCGNPGSATPLHVPNPTNSARLCDKDFGNFFTHDTSDSSTHYGNYVCKITPKSKNKAMQGSSGSEDSENSFSECHYFNIDSETSCSRKSSDSNCISESSESNIFLSGTCGSDEMHQVTSDCSPLNISSFSDFVCLPKRGEKHGVYLRNEKGFGTAKHHSIIRWENPLLSHTYQVKNAKNVKVVPLCSAKNVHTVPCSVLSPSGASPTTLGTNPVVDRPQNVSGAHTAEVASSSETDSSDHWASDTVNGVHCKYTGEREFHPNSQHSVPSDWLASEEEITALTRSSLYAKHKRNIPEKDTCVIPVNSCESTKQRLENSSDMKQSGEISSCDKMKSGGDENSSCAKHADQGSYIPFLLCDNRIFKLADHSNKIIDGEMFTNEVVKVDERNREAFNGVVGTSKGMNKDTIYSQILDDKCLGNFEIKNSEFDSTSFNDNDHCVQQNVSNYATEKIDILNDTTNTEDKYLNVSDKKMSSSLDSEILKLSEMFESDILRLSDIADADSVRKTHNKENCDIFKLCYSDFDTSYMGECDSDHELLKQGSDEIIMNLKNAENADGEDFYEDNSELFKSTSSVDSDILHLSTISDCDFVRTGPNDSVIISLKSVDSDANDDGLGYCDIVEPSLITIKKAVNDSTDNCSEHVSVNANDTRLLAVTSLNTIGNCITNSNESDSDFAFANGDRHVDVKHRPRSENDIGNDSLNKGTTIESINLVKYGTKTPFPLTDSKIPLNSECISAGEGRVSNSDVNGVIRSPHVIEFANTHHDIGDNIEKIRGIVLDNTAAVITEKTPDSDSNSIPELRASDHFVLDDNDDSALIAQRVEDKTNAFNLKGADKPNQELCPDYHLLQNQESAGCLLQRQRTFVVDDGTGPDAPQETPADQSSECVNTVLQQDHLLELPEKQQQHLRQQQQKQLEPNAHPLHPDMTPKMSLKINRKITLPKLGKTKHSEKNKVREVDEKVDGGNTSSANKRVDEKGKDGLARVKKVIDKDGLSMIKKVDEKEKDGLSTIKKLDEKESGLSTIKKLDEKIDQSNLTDINVDENRLSRNRKVDKDPLSRIRKVDKNPVSRMKMLKKNFLTGLAQAQRGSGTANNNNNNNNKKRGDGNSSPDSQGSGIGEGVVGSTVRSTSSSRRAMKIGAKNETSKASVSRTPNLNTPLNRTRSGSRSSGGSSPAGLHGRGPHKTAVVAPAPSRPTPKGNSLNRFGFRNSTREKSGDSTDSVNSILSDAQTASDSNSNIFELCDEGNDNGTTATQSDRLTDNAYNNSRIRSEWLQSQDQPKVPTTPSNSNVPKPGVLSNRITAYTRQLPKPQVVTVKSVSPKIPTPLSCSPKPQSPLVSSANSNRTRSPSARSLVHTPLKTQADPHTPTSRQRASTALRTPREPRDSESSSKSGTEVDSGLGSSSESDRIRAATTGDGETDTLGSSNVESTEDISDAWLKKTRQQQQSSSSGSKRKSRGSMEIQFNGTSSFEVKRRSLEAKEKESIEAKVSSLSGQLANPSPQTQTNPSSLDKKELGKDKRETTITYGMARQKFAPYSRGRYGYGYSSSRIGSSSSPAGSASAAASLPASGAVTAGSSDSPSPGVTKIPGSSGLVRNRVAMLETPHQGKKTSSPSQQTVLPRRSHLKKPLIRPTSLEKTPILVMPITEKTVELSKPVCRKLEYSENTAVVTPKRAEDESSEERKTSPGGKDLKNLIHHSPPHVSQPVVGDILIVGSVEVETHKDSNVVLEADLHGSFYESYDKSMSLSIGAGEGKALRDTSESEKAVEEVRKTPQESDEHVENGEVCAASLETPDDSGIKLLSPQSESSFEILESLSEATDLTTEEEVRKDEEREEETRKDIEMEERKEEEEEKAEEKKRSSAESLGGEINKVQSIIRAINQSGKQPPSPSPDSVGEVDASSTLSSEPSAVSSAVRDTKLPTKLKPSLLPKSAEFLMNPSGIPRVEQCPAGKSQASGNSSPTDSKRPPRSPASGQHPSVDLRCSMESSVESQKSIGITSTLGESGEPTGHASKRPPQSPVTSHTPLARHPSNDLRASMESSVESHKSAGMFGSLAESGEYPILSGKCTPTLASGRSDLDQDFLIDDEIADQPGLMFGGSATMASSFFTDEGIFDDIATSPPSHAQLKQVIAESGRSRANSIDDTTSSVGADDLMLDYFDMDETKAGGYEEEVLSPDANEIFSEWAAMMAEVSGSSAGSSGERCVSREGSTTGSGGGGGGGRGPRTRLSSSSELSSSESRRPTVLRPPRQGGLTEIEGGVGGGGSGSGLFVDRTSYHYMCQDVTSLKTMLLRLRRVLQAAETINPFDANLRNSLYLSIASSESPVGTPGHINGDKDALAPSVNELSQENLDLRRQVVLLQQQLQDRDRTIRLLQQQLAQSLENQQQQQPQLQQPNGTAGSETSSQSSAGDSPSSGASSPTVNAATQTERTSRSTALTSSSLSRTASIDDGLGPTVSSEIDYQRRGRSISAPDQRQPRAASQPPSQLVR